MFQPPNPSWRLFTLVFVCGLVFGALGTALVSGYRNAAELRELGERADQVGRDLDQARLAQRDAQDRAGRLQEELGRLGSLARDLEIRTGQSEVRARRIDSGAGQLALGIERARDQCGELGEGIARAQGSAEESGLLLAELGSILRGLQDDGGNQNPLP